MSLKPLKLWLPVIAWAVLIFFFSSNPDPYRYLPESWRYLIPMRSVSDSSLAEWLGQLMHFVEYAVFAFLLSRALYHNQTITSKSTLVVILLSMFYALSDEIHQLFVPGRAFQLIDLTIDLIGTVVGILLFKKLWNSENAKIN